MTAQLLGGVLALFRVRLDQVRNVDATTKVSVDGPDQNGPHGGVGLDQIQHGF